MEADPSVAMHATLAKADSRLNGKGEKTYKIAFQFPADFVAEVDAIVGALVDVYWNENLVGVNATVTGLTTRPVKDEPSVRTVALDADPGDTARAHLSDEVGTVGDCRLRVTQLVAFGTS